MSTRRGSWIRGRSIVMALVLWTAMGSTPCKAESSVTSPAMTLPEVLQAAMAANPDLGATRAALDAARGERTIARTYPFNPVIEWSRSTDKFGINEGERSLSIGISEEWEIGGQWAFRAVKGNREYRARVLDFQDGLREFKAEVQSAFYRLLRLEEEEQLDQDLVENAEALLAATRDRVKAGDVPALDLDVAMLEAVKSRNALALTRASTATARLALNRLIGRSPDTPLDIAGTFEESFSISDLARAQALAREYRPDAQAQKSRRDAAHTDLLLARADSLPNLTTSLTYASDRSVLDLPNDISVTNRDRLIGLRLSLPIPIFNWKIGERAKAAAQEREAEFRLTAKELQVREEVAAAWTSFQTQGEVYHGMAAEALPLQAELLERTREGYTLGEFDLTSVLLQQDRAVAIRRQYLDSALAYALARVDLEHAIGTDGSSLTKGE